MNTKLLTLTLLYSGLLILLGVIGYFATGSQSVTALIPTFFGIVVLLVALIMRRLTQPTTTGWVLLALALIGIAATASGVPKAIQYLGDIEIARPAAAISQAVMAVVSLIFAVAYFFTTRKPSNPPAAQ